MTNSLEKELKSLPRSMQNAIAAGAKIKIKFTYPDGQELNIRISEEKGFQMDPDGIDEIRNATIRQERKGQVLLQINERQ